MKGIELTRTGPERTEVWIPLNSIALVQPYIGFDGRKDGTEIVLFENAEHAAVQVTEEYVRIVEELNEL